MGKTITKSWRDQIRDVTAAYRAAGQSWPTTSLRIAAWGFNEGLLTAHRGNVIKYYAKEISRTLREEYRALPARLQFLTQRVGRGQNECGAGQIQSSWPSP